ncbi:MAG: AAA family ATPase [Methanobrevibacter sp.]|nr:AAA family ATPase [Methanobrevibacter sp.]
MSQKNFFDIIDEEGTIFQNKEVFNYTYTPEVVKYRDKQMEQIAWLSHKPIDDFTPLNMEFTGNVATGKTTTVMKYFEIMKAKHGDMIETVLVNCNMNRTEHRIYTKIHEELIGKPSKKNGLNIFDIYDSVISYLIKNNKILLVALDDYDHISSTDLNKTLYSLIRAYENKKHAKICVITITNRRRQLILSPAVHSSLQPREIYFNDYSAEDIYYILRDRCRLGFYDNVISDNVIQHAARLTYHNGDLRSGIRLIYEAGCVAESEGYKKVFKKHLNDIEKQYQQLKR